MLETFKKLFGGVKAAAPVASAATIPNDEAWASFEVDPELAYHCRDQSAAPAEGLAHALPPATAVPSQAAPSVTPAAEVVLPEFRLMSAETPDSDGLTMDLGLEAPAAVAAATPTPKKARAPAKKKPVAKGRATKGATSATTTQPKSTTRRASIDLRAAWNFNFPEKSHDDSVETVRLELAIAE